MTIEENAKHCPKCGLQGHITDTRKRQAGYVARRYVCSCGEHWTTAEVRVVEASAKAMAQLMTFLNRGCTTKDLAGMLFDRLK